MDEDGLTSPRLSVAWAVRGSTRLRNQSLVKVWSRPGVVAVFAACVETTVNKLSIGARDEQRNTRSHALQESQSTNQPGFTEMAA